MNLGKGRQKKYWEASFYGPLFSEQCCPQNLSISKVKIKQHLSSFCQRPHNMAIGFQLLRFTEKWNLLERFFEIDPGVCSFWDLEDYYLFASPIVHIGRPPWDGPTSPLPATILPILSYSYQLILTSSSFLPWNSFSLIFNRRWCTFFEPVYFLV